MSDKVDILVKREVFLEKGTPGNLTIPDRPSAIPLYTLELPRLDEDEDGANDNTKSKSCILAGTYEWEKIKETASGKFRETGAIWVKDVPGRSSICLHPGNFTREIKGCILVGFGKHTTPRGEPVVTKSVDAFHYMMALLPQKGKIRIENP